MGGNSSGSVVIDINGPQPVVTPYAVDVVEAAVGVGDRARGRSGARDRRQRASTTQLNDVNTSAEIWNPATGQWTVGPSGSRARLYHSGALLLPDASVLVTGGGAPGPLQNLHAEIYYPSYLYNASGGFAPRPTIVTAPDYARDRRQDFSIGVGSGRHPPADAGQDRLGHAQRQHGPALPRAAVHRVERHPVRADDRQGHRRAAGLLPDVRVQPERRAVAREDRAGQHSREPGHRARLHGDDRRHGRHAFQLSCNADETLVGVYGNSAGTYVNRVGAAVHPGRPERALDRRPGQSRHGRRRDRHGLYEDLSARFRDQRLSRPRRRSSSTSSISSAGR